MSDSRSLHDRLSDPFPASAIGWKPQSVKNNRALAVAYIDARDVMERLDEIFGINWQCRYSHAEAKTVCEIGIKFSDEWIWRADGAGRQPCWISDSR